CEGVARGRTRFVVPQQLRRTKAALVLASVAPEQRALAFGDELARQTCARFAAAARKEAWRGVVRPGVAGHAAGARGLAIQGTEARYAAFVRSAASLRQDVAL